MRLEAWSKFTKALAVEMKSYKLLKKVPKPNSPHNSKFATLTKRLGKFNRPKSHKKTRVNTKIG